ncbi:MAG: hypothetical protein HQ492_04815, partial [Woeseiaceae bacterium]|nr:hypothetical protein [Woeseiaceae bacterium]
MGRLIIICLVLAAVGLALQPAPELPEIGENWEQDRALASLEIHSSTFLMANGDCQVLSRLRVQNVGTLSFALIGLNADFETTGDLAADWDRNSLLHSELSLGITGLRRVGPAMPNRAKFSIDNGKQSWFIIDPHRVVDFSYVQPTRGSGELSTSFLLELQPVTFDKSAGNLTVPRTVRGVERSALPESGDGEVSSLLVYPYSASDMLV